MKRYYKDFYGGTASIAETKSGSYRLRYSTVNGSLVLNKCYETFGGARLALGKFTEGLVEEVTR